MNDTKIINFFIYVYNKILVDTNNRSPQISNKTLFKSIYNNMEKYLNTIYKDYNKLISYFNDIKVANITPKDKERLATFISTNYGHVENLEKTKLVAYDKTNADNTIKIMWENNFNNFIDNYIRDHVKDISIIYFLDKHYDKFKKDYSIPDDENSMLDKFKSIFLKSLSLENIFRNYENEKHLIGGLFELDKSTIILFFKIYICINEQNFNLEDNFIAMYAPA